MSIVDSARALRPILLVFAVLISFRPIQAGGYFEEVLRFSAAFEKIDLQLGNLANKGFSPRRLADEQRKLLTRLTAEGNNAARCVLARRFFYGADHWTADTASAVRLMEADDIGFCPHGFRILANAYRDGIVVDKSPETAEFWFRSAVASQSGLITEFEETPASDLDDLRGAQEWFQEVIKSGPDAGLAAAREYFPRLPSPDGGHLVYLILFATTELDHPEINFELGRAIVDRKVSLGTDEEGRRWLRMAAMRGHVDAQVYLAKSLLSLPSRPSRYADAYVWLWRAKMNGANVTSLLGLAGSNLSENDRRRAEERARKNDFPK